MFRRPNVDLFLGVPFKGQHVGSSLREIEEFLFALQFLDGAPKTLVSLFHVFDVSCRRVPPKYVARFISQRVESKQEPAVLSVSFKESRLVLEREAE